MERLSGIPIFKIFTNESNYIRSVDVKNINIKNKQKYLLT